MVMLRARLAARGLNLAPGLDELRPQQAEAEAWALEQDEPYLLINAPTGSGKTLLLGVLGTELGGTWTYVTHRIALQEQAARTFPGLPVLTGRANHACLIGEETHQRTDIMADSAICAAGEWCEYSGKPPENPDDQARWADHDGTLCGYYARRAAALASPYRTTNYAMFLRDVSLAIKGTTETLLCDEAHNVENVVCSQMSFKLARGTFARLGVDLPDATPAGGWARWAEAVAARLKPARRGARGKPDWGYITVAERLRDLRGMVGGPEDWVIVYDEGGVTFTPVWGRHFVRRTLMRHGDTGPREGGVRKVVLTSATLMGPDFIADMLGLPGGSWAYLDLPSTFPDERRPINYAPVMSMNREVMSTPGGRAPMQRATDEVIDRYAAGGTISGVIHAVSNRYRDQVLTESRWAAILTADVAEHEARARQGQPSVLVSANSTEGWDGIDDLCRFVIMPKVPYPNLGDERIRRRKEEDSRTFDHAALVAVVQGAGRGMRHPGDYCDTFILDRSWTQLYARRKAWLPKEFLSAYKHNVTLT